MLWLSNLAAFVLFAGIVAAEGGMLHADLGTDYSSIA